MSRVVLDHVAKTYANRAGGVAAVRDISLTIADGEFMVLVGPSGCGKSTLLRLVAGLETPDAGTIAIGERIVNDVPPKDRDLAMVFQSYALYPHLTVFDNLAFGLKLRKLPRTEIESRVRAAAAQLGLEGVLDRLPKALSGGQRQRVAVGRAIVRQPQVFLFDEPLSNLDAKLRAATRAELIRLHQRLRATMLYVTHDQVEAMTMGDRICVLHEGRVQQVAPPLELYQRPANLFVAGFIGSPPMNFLPGTVKQSAAGLVFVTTDSGGSDFQFGLSNSALALRAPDSVGQSVILGVRPEHLLEAKTSNPQHSGTLATTIEFIEPMGAETFLHLRYGRQTLIAKVSPEKSYAPGTAFEAVLSPKHIHFFDATTGTALS